MARLARFLEALYAAPPPDPLSARLRAARAAPRRAQGLDDLLRILPMPVAELLDDWFENDALKGALGAAGVLHLLQGPRSGGTAFRFLHHHVGCPPGVFRPPRSNIVELLHRLPRVELQQAELMRISVRGGAVAGVVLKDGRELEASTRGQQCRSAPQPARAGGARLARSRARARAAPRAAPRRSGAHPPRARPLARLFGARRLRPRSTTSSEPTTKRSTAACRASLTSKRAARAARMEVLVQYAPYGVALPWSLGKTVALLSASTGATRSRSRPSSLSPRELEDSRRLARRPAAPRRAEPRPGAVDAPAARARALPHADRRPVALRAGDASGRRHRRRRRPELRA